MSKELTAQDRVDMERVDTEYEYVTQTQDSTTNIDMGIDMIKRGECNEIHTFVPPLFPFNSYFTLT